MGAKFFRSNYFPVKSRDRFEQDFCRAYHLRLITTPAYPEFVGFEGHVGDGLEGYPCLIASGERSVPPLFRHLAEHIEPGHVAIVMEVWFGAQEDDEGGITGVAVAINHECQWVQIDLGGIFERAAEELGGEATPVEG